MRKLLSNLLIIALCIFTVHLSYAQTYDQCGYVGPSNPATEPGAATNPDYPAVQVICADGSFPECSAPAPTAADFAADCGSPNFDFIITNPQNTATGDGGAAIVGVSPDGLFNPTGAAPPDFAVGDMACVTGFCYDLQQIQDLVDEINNNGSACSAAESIAGVPVCPIPVPNSLGDLFTLAAAIGGGGVVSVGDVVAILPQIDMLSALGITNVPVCGLLSGGDTAAGANLADYCMMVVDCAAGSPCEEVMAGPCDGVDLAAAPAAPVVTAESTCEADGATLSGGMIDYTAVVCPAGSTLEYSTDGMTFTTSAPMYDQMNAITVTVRCTCDADMTMTSPTAMVTTVPGTCNMPPMDGCTAMAGEALPDAPTMVCGTQSVAGNAIFGPASGGFDDGMGNIEPVVTNYAFVDANGNLISVTDSQGTNALDFSMFAEGEQVCIYQFAYTQATLNAVTMFLDDLLCNTLCVDIPLAGTTCLGDVGFCPGVTPTELAPLIDILNTAFGFNEMQFCDLIDNNIITITDPTGLIGDQVIDLDALGIGLCADKSMPYCVTVSEMACAEPVVCDLMAGEPNPPNDTVCATGTATMGEVEQGVIDVTGVFGPPTTMAMNFTPVQDYVIFDPVTNQITSVSSTAVLDLSMAMIGDQACVSSFSYFVELIELLGEGLEDQLCNTLCIPDPANPLNQLCPGDLLPNFMCGDMITDFAMLLDLLNDLNNAQGLTNVTFDDVVQLCETQMLTINPGLILGVPGLPDVNIDLTLIPGLMGDGFCCDFSNNQHCLTVIDCSVAAVCDGIDLAAGLPVIPTEVCSGAMADICLTLVDATQGLTVTGTIDGAPVTLMGAPGAGPNELCVSITAPINMTCDIVPVNIQIDAIQCADGTDYPGILGGATLVDDLTTAGFNPIAIPVYPTLSVNTMGDGMCGTLVAELVAADGTVCATAAGSPFMCVNDGDVLDYDFTGDPALANFTAPPADCPLPALMGTLICAMCNVPPVAGCTDPCAPNFDPAATMDDGSCEPYDMTCNQDCTMGPFGGIFDPVNCMCMNETAPVLGCTDPNADNFNAAANCDDGSCIITQPCNFSVGVSAFTCNDGGTMDDPADDTADVTFVVLSNGSSWTTDVAIGGVTSGMDGMMLTEMGVPAGTNIVVTFTSDDDPNCTFVLDYTVPDCTVQIPTLSQWGLITLALLLMIMGSLKMGFNSIAFQQARKK